MTDENQKEIVNTPERPREPYPAVSQSVSPSLILQQAVDKGSSIEQLTSLLDLQERYERREAEKAFHLSLARFKADPPKILKDRHVAYDSSKGRVEYDHASLANVVYSISESLSKYGLSATWETSQESGLVTVTCHLSHELGHQAKVSLSAGADSSGGKNSIQAVGSTVSYLQRYTLLAITGLATHEQDDDGRNATPSPVNTANTPPAPAFSGEKISDDQIAEISDLIAEKGRDLNGLLSFLSMESRIVHKQLSDMPVELYPRVIKMLNAKSREQSDTPENPHQQRSE